MLEIALSLVVASCDQVNKEAFIITAYELDQKDTMLIEEQYQTEKPPGISVARRLLKSNL